MVFLERDEWIGQTVNEQRGAHGPCTLCIALHTIGSDLNALEGINTLPSGVPVKARILENSPCSPGIALVARIVFVAALHVER